MADPEGGLSERSIFFKELPQFLKSNWISLAYGLTSNKDQTSINKSCFVFSLYRGRCRFCAIFGRFVGMTAFGLFGSAFEGHGFPPPVNTYMCIPTEFRRRCLHRLFRCLFFFWIKVLSVQSDHCRTGRGNRPLPKPKYRWANHHKKVANIGRIYRLFPKSACKFSPA